jgi:hypothetical protein
VKDLSKYIESLLDDHMPDKKVEVKKDNDKYSIKITINKENFNPETQDSYQYIMSFTTDYTINDIMKTFFPDNQVIFHTTYIFV